MALVVALRMRALHFFSFVVALTCVACDSDSTAPADDGEHDAIVDGGHEDAGGDQDAGDAEVPDMSIHLHHVHMNVSDKARSMAFYEDHFGAAPVALDDGTEALAGGPILTLLDEVQEPPSNALPTALQHVGWGSADPIAWFEREHALGVEPDTRGHSLFPTNETPSPSGTAESFKALVGIDFPACFTLNDEISYIYVLGPDGERIELWSGDDDHVNHVHLTTADMTSTVAWYKDFLGVDTGTGTFFLDGILFFFEPDGEAASYEPTDSHVLGHIAFSVADLSAWRARVDELEIEVVEEPAEAYGFESFFVRGPDGLLIELVDAAPSELLCPGGP